MQGRVDGLGWVRWVGLNSMREIREEGGERRDEGGEERKERR